MPRFAVIDVGTNSVKLHVAERREDNGWEEIRDRSVVTRLGEGLRGTGGELLPAAMERTLTAIQELAEEARAFGSVELAAVGTMGLRTAANRTSFLADTKRRTGVDIDVVSGVEEGRLAYLAVQSGPGIPNGSLVVFDTGGGSSQFTFGRGALVTARFSLDVGAVRITETFGLANSVTPAALRSLLEALGRELSRLDGSPSPDAVVGLGGAVTNLASVMHGLAVYDPAVIQGSVLSLAEIDRQIDLYATRPAAARRSIPGLQPQRAEVILAGACIVRTVLGKLGRHALSVSDRGLRHGVLVDRFGRR